MPAPDIRLHQQRVYRSITQLQDTTLPPFTLLTGLNGSGKTHLLEAIRDGDVTTNVADSQRPGDIQLLTWHNLVPNDVGITNVTQIYQHRDWFITHLRNRRGQQTPNLLGQLRAYGLDKEFAASPWNALDLSTEELAVRLGDEQRAQKAASELQNFRNDLVSTTRNGFGNDAVKTGVFDQLLSLSAPLHRLNATHFEDASIKFYMPGLFQHSFGDLFLSYFDRVRANKYRRMDVSEGKTPDLPPIPDDEFNRRYGEPPWDFVNRILKRAKLDFRIDHPTLNSTTEYLPKLTKISSSTDVDFGSLSSGEKVLMSFALCLYNSTDDRLDFQKPKLLLFDEIDAPLHPSMSRILVSIINDVIVKEKEIPVIMVTHSPSTVAVSPDRSIHLLEPVTNIITNEQKRRAVSTLTSDIPTLSIDFSGRRQILVESDLDADRYSNIYQILAPHFDSERSLSFIGVGRTGQITGCDQVISTVNHLAAAGNISVLGLVDWDGKRDGTNRVHVLGEGERYAIENYLLDPLLLLALLINENPQACIKYALPVGTTFVSLSTLGDAEIQAAVNFIQGSVIERLRTKGDAVPTVQKYHGGRSLTLDGRYLLHNGHEIEDAIMDAFPPLQRYRGNGKLMDKIVNLVVRNQPGLLPTTLAEKIKTLLETDIE